MTSEPKPGCARGRIRRALLAAALIALVGSACGNGGADPGAVLADFAEARNEGDVDAVVALFAEDAVIENHPLDGDGIATGREEIRSLESRVPGIQGSNGGIVFSNLVVSGNTVTFDHRFDNASGTCFGGTASQVTVEDDKITRYVWGPDSREPCG